MVNRSYKDRIIHSMSKYKLILHELLIVAFYLIVSITVAAIISNHYFASSMKTMIEKESQVRINSIQREFTSVIEACELIHHKLYQNARLTKRAIAQNSLQAREIFYNYRDVNPYLYNIYYDYGDPTYVLTFWGYINKELIYLPYDQLEQFIKLGNNLRKPTLINSREFQSKARDHLLFIFPDTDQRGYVMVFRLDIEHFRANIVSATFEDHEHVYVLREDGSPLLSFNPNNTANLSDQLSAMTDNPPNVGTIDINNASYSYARSTDTNGFVFVRLIDEQYYVVQASRLNSNVIIWMIFMVSLGLILIIYLLRKIHRPIKSLARSITVDPKTQLDEISVIRQAYELSEQQKNHFRANYDSAIPTLRNIFFHELLHGAYMSRAEFSEKCSSLSIHFPHPWFTVFCFSLNHKPESQQLLRHYVLSSFPNDTIVYFFASSEENFCNGIINTQNRQNDALEKLLMAFKTALEAHLNTRVTVSMGTTVKSYQELNRSFVSARAAYQYRFLLGDDHILLDQQTAGLNVASMPYPAKEMSRLSTSINTWDSDDIERALKDVREYILSNHLDLRASRCICLDIIGMFSNAVAVLDRTLAQNFHQQFDIYALAEIGSIDALIQTIRQLSDQISQFIKRNINQTTPSSADIIIGILRENIGNKQFSLSSLADTFGLSYQSLHRLFKEVTGHSMIEHFNLLKTETSKQLLCSTDISVDEIACKVGYDATTSFIRMFKKETGLTPGAYRRSCNLS